MLGGWLDVNAISTGPLGTSPFGALVIVVLGGSDTLRVADEDEDAANVLEPLYAATIEYVPSFSALEAGEHWPEPATNEMVQSFLPLAVIVTVPEGVPPEPVTEAEMTAVSSLP